jgi:hypothetical protein
MEGDTKTGRSLHRRSWPAAAAAGGGVLLGERLAIVLGHAGAVIGEFARKRLDAGFQLGDGVPAFRDLHAELRLFNRVALSGMTGAEQFNQIWYNLRR